MSLRPPMAVSTPSFASTAATGLQKAARSNPTSWGGAMKVKFTLPRSWYPAPPPDSDGWEPPIPFATVETPDFPTESLPGPLAAFVECLADQGRLELLCRNGTTYYRRPERERAPLAPPPTL